MGFDLIDRKFQRSAPAPVCEQIEWEEGGDCPKCHAIASVVMAYPDGGCSCHINPPCGRCTSSFHQCSTCGEDDSDQPA